MLALVTAWQAVQELRRLRSDIEIGTQRSRLYRELQPARTVGLHDARLFLTAERLVPRTSTFAVVTGPATGTTDPLVLRWVGPFARYRLFPRRLTEDPRRADWVLSFGGDLAALPVRYRRVVRIGRGLSLAEVEQR